LLDIGDAIKLKILRSTAVKSEYSLDDLRDLESKLVLITGKESAVRNETDKFLNVCEFFDCIGIKVIVLGWA